MIQAEKHLLETREGTVDSLVCALDRFIRERHQALALERLLWAIGEILELDRVILITLSPESALLRAEWHSYRVHPHPRLREGEARQFLLHGPFASWRETLRSGEVIEGAVRERPAAERALLEELGSRWFLALPVIIGGTLNGVLVLDDCHRERALDPLTRRLLRLCATSMGCRLDEEMEWRQRLERNRLATMGRLAARVAHEINNPLAGIRNVLLLLHRELEGDEKKQARLALVDRELERVGRIIHRLFQLHHDEEVQASPVACRPLSEELLALLQGTAREREVQLALAAAGELRVLLPESLLREVLFNLLLNAIEASPEGAVVELGWEVRDGQPRIEVRDRGHGLPDTDPDFLMEPFYTTKEETGGLGLGLSICQELMEYMDGELRLLPRPGGGTVASLTFPGETLLEAGS